MLTPTEREWLIKRRELLISAAAKADIYAGAHAAACDTPVRWWRPIRAIKLIRTRRRTKALTELWDNTVFRGDSVINTWLNIYQATTGETRGPILSQSWVDEVWPSGGRP